MEESTEKNLFGEAIKTGVIIAWKLGLSVLIVSFVILVFTGKKFRDETYEGGFMTFGESFKFSFSAFFISSIISMFFMILLYEVVDPELPKIITDQALENTEAMMENFGAPAEKIDETLAQVELDMAGKFTIGGILSGSWIYIITSAIFGAIGAAIIKKKKPEFE